MPETPRSFATTQVQAGYQPGVAENTAVPPIHQSNAFQFSSLSEARDLFALRREGNIYSRAANPTVLTFERRVAELEGGIAAAGVASGQAAVALSLLALAKQGEHIVAARQLYGGTVDLLQDTFADWGIDVTFVDQDDTARVGGRGPPADARLLRRVDHQPDRPGAGRAGGRPTSRTARGCRSSSTTPSRRPICSGRRMSAPTSSVHSATKLLGGHGTSLGGVVVDLGTFDFAADPQRWPQLNERRTAACPAGASWSGSARPARPTSRSSRPSTCTTSARRCRRSTPSSCSRASRRSTCRVARHSESALGVARFLEQHPAVARVHHPGLESSPWHEAARVYLPRGAGSVFSFDLHATGDPEEDFRQVEEFIARLRVVRLVANIGDARSLVAHPASMTHSHMSSTQLAEAGIGSTTVRLSIGLEDLARHHRGPRHRTRRGAGPRARSVGRA